MSKEIYKNSVIPLDKVVQIKDFIGQKKGSTKAMLIKDVEELLEQLKTTDDVILYGYASMRFLNLDNQVKYRRRFFAQAGGMELVTSTQEMLGDIMEMQANVTEALLVQDGMDPADGDGCAP